MRRRAEEARVARMATVHPRGWGHLVPIVFVLEGGVLYTSVDAKPKRTPELRRIRNIRSNPQVTVLVDHYDEAWEQLWWVRLRGPARILEEGEERARAVALLREKYPQYRDMPPQGAVIAVDVEEWRGWAWRSLQ